jgi:threonine/homoserine/homoserine lactone efflux protein
MDFQSFWDGAVAGYGIAVPVGAIAVLIIDSGIRRGLAAGLQAGAGSATADFIYASAAALGGSLLQSMLMPLADTFRMLGGGALIAIGGWGLWRSWQAQREQEGQQEPAMTGGRTYLTFLGLTLLNPLTIVYFSALILGDLHAERTALSRLFFVAGAGLASLSWQWLLAVFGTYAGRRLPEKAGRILSALGNLVVVFLGTRLLI